MLDGGGNDGGAENGCNSQGSCGSIPPPKTPGSGGGSSGTPYVELSGNLIVSEEYPYLADLAGAYATYSAEFTARNGFGPDQGDEIAFWHASCSGSLKQACGTEFTSRIGTLWQYEYGFGEGQTPPGGGVAMAITAGGAVLPLMGAVTFGTPTSSSAPFKGTPGNKDAPYIESLANAIDGKYPGAVVGVETPIYKPNGDMLTDADIQLRNAVIQVKSGKAKGLSGQLRDTAAGLQEDYPDMQVVGYAPQKPSPFMIQAAAAQGTPIFTDPDELMNYLQQGGGFGGVFSGEGDDDAGGGGGE